MVVQLRTDKTIGHLFASARRNSRKLSDWMYANHEPLLREIGTDRVDWTAAMIVIRKLRLVDAHGKLPSKDTAFRTWKRVQERINRDRPHTGAVAADEIAPGVRSLRIQPQSADMGARPRLEIRPVRANNGIQTDHQTPSLTTPNDVHDRNDTDAASAEIQRVFDEIGASRTPMPIASRK